MAFEVSEYVDPVTAPRKNTSDFFDKLSNCPVGKAFVVKGMVMQNLHSRVSRYKKESGKDFAVNKINSDDVQVTRLS